MDEDVTPTPQPDGSLLPPVRRPPTALAVHTPPPPPTPRPRSTARPRGLIGALGRGVTRVLDALDEAGDAIAGLAGLRR